MSARRYFVGAIVLGAAAVFIGGCGEESDYGPLTCVYEESSTGCSGSGYGPWEEKCFDIDNPREDLTPETWCDAVVSDTTECASSCCVSFRFRNAVGYRGTCSDVGF